MPTFLRNYLQRHQHPGNLALHIVGLPVTFLLPIGLLITQAPGWALLSFIAGYALQFLGHAIEGNDAGEMILFKKLLGLPYIAVVPRPVKAAVRNTPRSPLRADPPHCTSAGRTSANRNRTTSSNFDD